MTDPFARVIQDADRSGRPISESVRHHFLETVLRQVTSEQFALRGSMFTRSVVAPFPRSAADLDFLGCFHHDVAGTADRFFPKLTDAAGICFHHQRFQAKGIWPDSAFPGVRLTITADVFDRPIGTTIDVGFGDPLVPPAEWRRYETIVDEPVSVWAVHPMTMIAWKLHGLAEWGEAGWRAKDVLDLWLLTGTVPLEESLTPALRAAFESRGYPAADAWHTLTHPTRWVNGQGKWAKLLRDHRVPGVPTDFCDVIADLRERLGPAAERLLTPSE